MHIADETPITGREMSFGQMKAGMVRGGGIDRKFEQAVQAMNNLDEATLDAICAAMGADHYFTVEDAVTVAKILIDEIAVPENRRSFVNQ